MNIFTDTFEHERRLHYQLQAVLDAITPIWGPGVDTDAAPVWEAARACAAAEGYTHGGERIVIRPGPGFEARRMSAHLAAPVCGVKANVGGIGPVSVVFEKAPTPLLKRLSTCMNASHTPSTGTSGPPSHRPAP